MSKPSATKVVVDTAKPADAPVPVAATPVVEPVAAPAVPAAVTEPVAVAAPVVEAPAAPTPVTTPAAATPEAGYTAKHFKLSEFACSCCGEVKVDPELLEVLDDVREHFNSPVTITSGYRCDAHNEAVGGKPGSKHKEGIAGDFLVLRVPPRVVQKYLLAKYDGKYGIGCYRNFTHIDVRETEARW